MSPAAALLAKLEGVRPAGDGRWYARCPAHDDTSPSLSIRDTGERVLVHCFTGCEAEAILAAVGLTWRDLYPDNPARAAMELAVGAARPAFKRMVDRLDPLELDRWVLRVAAADIRAGKVLTVEGRARVMVAKERLAKLQGARHG